MPTPPFNSSNPPNPPSDDTRKAESSGPVSAGGKKCTNCFLIRAFEHYGNSRTMPDGKLTSCKDCINQAHRILREKKYGRLKPIDGINDDVLRNNRHHNKALLKSFLSGTDYELHGVTLHIPTNKDYAFVLRLVPNTPLVELRIQDPATQQDVFFHGVDRLKEDAIEDLCYVLRDYRLEPSQATMRIAKYYIYSRA